MNKKIIKLTVFNLFIRKLDDYKIKIMYIFSQFFSAKPTIPQARSARAGSAARRR